ncbi:MAG: acyl-ACP--UDP-N-acetylglucosamine O-acyltransferase [Planctomycetota bacterium]
MGIHTTAVVPDGATIHPSVEIGPYAVVSAGTVLAENVRIGAHAVLEGSVEIGPGTRIFPHAVVGEEPQDLGFEECASGVRIGARTQIREFVSIHRGSKEGGWTTIGDDCMLMQTTHVAHDCRLGDRVVMVGGAVLAGHVEVGDRVMFGGISGAHQFCRIGRLSMIGGLRRVPRDVPPFTMVNHVEGVSAVNLVGMRRAGYDHETIRELQRMVKRLRDHVMPVSEQIEELADEARSEAAHEFVAAMQDPGPRGLITFAPR